MSSLRRGPWRRPPRPRPEEEPALPKPHRQIPTVTWLRRKTRLRQVNPERRADLYARNYGPHADWIRSQPCVVPGCRRTTIEAAHLVCRGMGGCKGDWRSLFPACAKHHGEQEGRTAEFQVRYGLDLAVLVEIYVISDPEVSENERIAAEKRLAVLRESR